MVAACKNRKQTTITYKQSPDTHEQVIAGHDFIATESFLFWIYILIDNNSILVVNRLLLQIPLDKRITVINNLLLLYVE
jgi:hypothetical protein